MNERLYWGVLFLIGLTISLFSALLRHYLTMRGSLAARSMLYKERMTALAKNQSMPEADPYPLLIPKSSRLTNVPLAKLVVVPGLVLSFGGLGLGIGLLCSGDFKKSGTLAMILFFLGIGLLIYLLLARYYFKHEWFSRDEEQRLRAKESEGSNDGVAQTNTEEQAKSADRPLQFAEQEEGKRDETNKGAQVPPAG